MKKITRQQFKNLLIAQAGKGAIIASFLSLTEADLKPGHNYGMVRKISYVNGLLQTNYERAVENQRIRESVQRTSPFKAEPRRWGEYVGNSAVLQHKDKHYLVVRTLKTKPFFFHYKDSKFKMLLKNNLINYLKDYKPTNQGVEKQVMVRNFSLDNIVSFSMNKEKYKIID